MKKTRRVNLSFLGCKSVALVLVSGCYLVACSSSDNPVVQPAPDDPVVALPGEPPVIDAEEVLLEPEVFIPPAGNLQNLLELMSASGTFTRLLSLIEQAGLTETLGNADTLTIFAPTDDAFAELDAATSDGLLASLATEELVDRLYYHAVDGNALDSTGLRDIDGRALVMANELPAAININNIGQLQINGAVIETPDLIASNGILHVIGSVLTPPLRPADPNDSIPPATNEDIATTLLRRSDYSTLLFLIELAGLTEALQEDNNGQGWTLFAPSDAAFNDIDLSTIGLAEATELVEMHLHPGTLASADLPDGTLQMSQGTVQVARADGLITVGGATIVGRDRVVGNGVIHFVGSILSADVN